MTIPPCGRGVWSRFYRWLKCECSLWDTQTMKPARGFPPPSHLLTSLFMTPAPGLAARTIPVKCLSNWARDQQPAQIWENSCTINSIPQSMSEASCWRSHHMFLKDIWAARSAAPKSLFALWERPVLISKSFYPRTDGVHLQRATPCFDYIDR